MEQSWIGGIESVRNKRILLSPLNWGMGHVARCIGLINKLLLNGNTVIIAGDVRQIEVFLMYFRDIEAIEHDGYPFRFGGKGRFEKDLFFCAPGLLRRLKREKEEVEVYVKNHAIDLVISDHRYGFYSTQVPSIFLSHQLHLPLKGPFKWVQRVHSRLIKRFDSIWVPDNSNHLFAGKLSRTEGFNHVFFIGPISRFEGVNPVEKGEVTVAIVSGPLAYAHSFIQTVQNHYAEGEKLVFIGDASLRDYMCANSLVFLPSTDWLKCDHLICSAKKVISRSGYSTLMDLHFLRTSATLVPTEGQSEQLYLFGIWNKHQIQRTTT
jgi:hypothetical protein